jgi:hypothetical protein
VINLNLHTGQGILTHTALWIGLRLDPVDDEAAGAHDGEHKLNRPPLQTIVRLKNSHARRTQLDGLPRDTIVIEPRTGSFPMIIRAEEPGHQKGTHEDADCKSISVSTFGSLCSDGLSLCRNTPGEYFR